MNETDALFAAILADPADDTARLAYADRLDETGDHDRAEFIRVQVALASTPDTEPARDALAERERQLLHAHGERWKGAHPAPQGVFGLFWGEFRRGFVHELMVAEPSNEDLRYDPTYSALLESAPIDQATTDALTRARAAAPLQKASITFSNGFSPGRADEYAALLRPRDLELTWDLKLAAWLAAPRAAGIRLHLQPSGSPEEVLQFLRSPHLGGIRSLNLNSIPADAGFAAELARAPGLAHLEALKIGSSGHRDGPRIGDAGLRALAGSPHLTRLRELELYNSRITAEGVQALAGSPTFANLMRLNMDGNPIGDAGAAALAETAHLRRLVHLNLSGCGLTARGLRALAGAPALETVRHLNLYGNDVGDDGTGALAAARWRLSHLHALGIGLTAAGARVLARAPALAGLISLHLNHNTELGPSGVSAVFDGPVWRDLRELHLASDRTDAKVVAAIAATQGLSGLHSLHLGFCPLGNAGVEALARWPGLESVRLLDLAYCKIGRAGADALLASALQPGANLRLHGNFRIPERAVARLRKKHGDAMWWRPRGSDDFD